jgi:hypothetical protein
MLSQARAVRRGVWRSGTVAAHGLLAVLRVMTLRQCLM